jgi:hypothetical protein
MDKFYDVNKSFPIPFLEKEGVSPSFSKRG